MSSVFMPFNLGLVELHAGDAPYGPSVFRADNFSF